jgi:hypothetical protein
MKYGQKLKLGDAHATPSSSTKISDHLSRHYIFIASYAMCFSWSVFIFTFSFFVFFAINGWTQHIYFGEDTLHFHCKKHSSFHFYRSTSVLFF